MADAFDRRTEGGDERPRSVVWSQRSSTYVKGMLGFAEVCCPSIWGILELHAPRSSSASLEVLIQPGWGLWFFVCSTVAQQLRQHRRRVMSAVCSFRGSLDWRASSHTYSTKLEVVMFRAGQQADGKSTDMASLGRAKPGRGGLHTGRTLTFDLAKIQSLLTPTTVHQRLQQQQQRPY